MRHLTSFSLGPGFAHCVRCRHIFLVDMLRLAFARLWCPWCLEQRAGKPHGTVDPASCGCRYLAR